MKPAQIIGHKKDSRLCPSVPGFHQLPVTQHSRLHLRYPARPNPSSPTRLSSRLRLGPFCSPVNTKLLLQPAVSSNPLLCSPRVSGEGRGGQGTSVFYESIPGHHTSLVPRVTTFSIKQTIKQQKGFIQRRWLAAAAGKGVAR